MLRKVNGYICILRCKFQYPGRMPEWLWGWLQEHYDFLATFMATPPVYPGFESQFDHKLFFFLSGRHCARVNMEQRWRMRRDKKRLMLVFRLTGVSVREGFSVHLTFPTFEIPFHLCRFHHHLFKQRHCPTLGTSTASSLFGLAQRRNLRALDERIIVGILLCKTAIGDRNRHSTQRSQSASKISEGHRHSNPTAAPLKTFHDESTITARCAHPHPRVRRLRHRMVTLLRSSTRRCILCQLRSRWQWTPSHSLARLFFPCCAQLGR